MSKQQHTRTNPNNCDACDHKHNPDGGWCYMFRRTPTEVCMRHTDRSVKADLLAALKLYLNAVELAGWEGDLSAVKARAAIKRAEGEA